MNTENCNYLKRNLEDVRAAIAAAAKKADRTTMPLLIAAVKYADETELTQLLSLGITDVGENRVQQLQVHGAQYAALGVTVHFIGHLQKNKVKHVVGVADLIHSVDSKELAAEINTRAAAKGIIANVLIEINSGREPDKSGVMPEEAEALLAAMLGMPHLSVKGLMTMGPRCADEADCRPYFAATRTLAGALWKKFALPGEPLLSMGMSESFGAAIAEGAHMVRIGRRLFAQDNGA